jgi:hypothetical protein
MPRAGPQGKSVSTPVSASQSDFPEEASMARPYSAGGVSIAQSNQHAVGPLLLAACGLSTISGPTFPVCSRRHPYCFRQHHTPDLGPRRGGAEERTGPGGPLLCIRIEWNMENEPHLRTWFGVGRNGTLRRNQNSKGFQRGTERPRNHRGRD